MSDDAATSEQSTRSFKILLLILGVVAVGTVAIIWSLASPSTISPREAALAVGSADTLKRLGKFEEAEAIYTQLLEDIGSEANVQSYYYNRANLRYRLERYEEAADDYKQAISYDPEGFLYQARWNLAQSYRQLGQKDLALQELKAFQAEYAEELPHLNPRVNKAIALLQQ